MPLRSLAFPLALLCVVFSHGQQGGRPFTLERERLSYDFVAGTLVAAQARATWGSTSLEADQITEQAGDIHAVGHVLLVDPLATLSTPELHYNYITRSGWARSVTIVGEGAKITAESVEMLPDGSQWVVRNGSATVCDRNPPDFLVRFDKLSIRPGDRARIYKGKVEVFGHRLFGLPNAKILLGASKNVLPVPALGYSKRNGISFGLRDWIELSPRMSLSAQWNAFAHAKAERTELISYSLLNPSLPDVLDTPDGEEGERFTYSYIDNVSVPTPLDEDARLLAPRRVLFFDNTANLPVAARTESDLIVSKDWEFGLQVNDRIGTVFGTLSLRQGRVAETPGTTVVNRTAAQGTLSSGAWQITPSLSLRARVDGGLFYYAHYHRFGWTRPIGEVVFEPTDRFRLAAALIRTYTDGTSILRFDEPMHLRSLHFRSDIRLIHARLSVLTKYDIDAKDFCDVEVAFAQRMHCIEPYIVWRKDPGEVRFGIRIPTLSVLQALAAKRAQE
jgi:hypothetical protein